MKVNTDNLHLATEQDVFDTVASHLLKQNQKSLNESGHCAYRTADGKMCAAGCLITEESYQENFEYYIWSSVIGKGNFSQNHYNLIQDLQKCHDNESCSDWPMYLMEIAKDYDLDSSVIKTNQ